MSGVRWVNQKIGNFFGDFKADRELAVEPGDVCRGITRLVCLVCLLSGFGVAFYRLFTDAPNVAVTRVYLQQKNANFSITRLYDETVAYGTDIDAANCANSSVISAESQEVLDCPCTTTTISWTTFVHFYIINYTALINKVTVMNYVVVNDSLTMLSGSSADDFEEKYISRDPVDLTNEAFCGNIVILPMSRFMTRADRNQLDCPAMVTGLLTTKPQKTEVPDGADPLVGSSNWNDPRASYFESPSLLNQKFLYSNTIRRLREISVSRTNFQDSSTGVESLQFTTRAELLISCDSHRRLWDRPENQHLTFIAYSRVFNTIPYVNLTSPRTASVIFSIFAM